MSDAAGGRAPCPPMIGHGGASGDFRFSTRVLARVANAFAVAAVHSARVEDLPWHPRQRSRKATTDFHFRRGQSRGRALSGRGALHFPILVFSLSKTPGSRGLKAPAPRCLFIVPLSIVRFPLSFSIMEPTGGSVALSLLSGRVEGGGVVKVVGG